MFRLQPLRGVALATLGDVFLVLYRNASWLNLRDEFTICYCQLSLLQGTLTKRCKQIIKYQLSRRIRTSHHLSQQPKLTTHNFPPGQIPGNISPVPCNFMTSDARSRWDPPPCQDLLFPSTESTGCKSVNVNGCMPRTLICFLSWGANILKDTRFDVRFSVLQPYQPDFQIINNWVSMRVRFFPVTSGCCNM